jgi:hypothetical protein
VFVWTGPLIHAAVKERGEIFMTRFGTDATKEEFHADGFTVKGSKTFFLNFCKIFEQSCCFLSGTSVSGFCRSHGQCLFFNHDLH